MRERLQSDPVIALALIRFEGGLNVGFGEIRPVLGVSLAPAIPGNEQSEWREVVGLLDR